MIFWKQNNIAKVILKRVQNSTSSLPFQIVGGECSYTDDGPTDEDGDGCTYYNNHPDDCGCCDDQDFVSNIVCCACMQGYTTYL